MNHPKGILEDSGVFCRKDGVVTNQTENDGNFFIKVQNLEKSFGHVRALRNVGLSILKGEVLAIVGDNGAGKSTLVKILSGAIRPDYGTIMIQSHKYDHLTPRQAIQMGISTVYQDLSLVECRDVASNIFLGRELACGPFIQKRRMKQIARTLLERLQIHIPSLDIPVGMLSGGQRQAVAVARAIHQGGRMIILDEPTAALGLRESAKVLALICMLRHQGYSVALISHNLHNVFSVSDRICVMRSGQRIGLLNRSDTCPDEVVQMITGTRGNGDEADD